MKWPGGFRSAGVSSGIKPEGILDAGLLVADEPARWSGVFTLNAAAAAPVQICRSRLGSPVRALVVNSGNANACTGAAGHAAALVTVDRVAQAVGCTGEEVLVASTGPIGVPLPVHRLTGAVPELVGALGSEVDSFARAILTTDTATKTSHATVGEAEIVGVAKGAAMLAPNMATMLAFVTTDAQLDAEELDRIVARVVARTFNRICVDACESTNDSVFVLSSGRTEVDPDAFEKGLMDVCGNLAEQMVLDAEGGSHLVRIKVSGAADEAAAAELGRAVSSSALWRAAMHGADPNWGRVLSALGSKDRSLDLSRVTLAIGGEKLFVEGHPAGDMDLAAKAMQQDTYEVTCVVGEGPGEAEVLTTDLSPEYVTLNAGGLT